MGQNRIMIYSILSLLAFSGSLTTGLHETMNMMGVIFLALAGISAFNLMFSRDIFITPQVQPALIPTKYIQLRTRL